MLRPREIKCERSGKLPLLVKTHVAVVAMAGKLHKYCKEVSSSGSLKLGLRPGSATSSFHVFFLKR